MSRGTIVIVGASVRAAAVSALRAGYQPYGIDLFADRDLRCVAECQRIEMLDYPAGIGGLMRKAPPGPWMYTGGLENHPELIEEWRRERELIGNGMAALVRVRDPQWLRQHVPFASSAASSSQAIDDNRWLLKPRRGAGGMSIDRWDGQPLPRDTYLQRFIPGRSVSAVFVGSDTGCRMVGSTWQLVGESWLHALPFRYCGSIGPRILTAKERQIWSEIGETLTDVGGLRGVFGVDAIISDSGLTVVEVNPRYPASAEVLELAEGLSVLAESSHQPSVAHAIIGKGISYAPFAFQFPGVGPWDVDLDEEWNPGRVPTFGDIPLLGESFRLSDPVVTIFATGDDEDQCLLNLRRQAQELDQLFTNCRGVNPPHLRQ
jgi:uncharacterized protein